VQKNDEKRGQDSAKGREGTDKITEMRDSDVMGIKDTIEGDDKKGKEGHRK
jgi:hypothetical protein